MSHKFKKPKQYLNQGTPLARLRKHVGEIKTQQQLEALLAGMKPETREAGLNLIRSWLRIKPPEKRLAE